MVANTLPRKLYIVVAPDRVADSIAIENSQHSIQHFRAFMATGLERTLAPYFREVEVVASLPPSAAATPHFVADVRLDNVVVRELVTSNLTYSTLVMQWAFAIRASEGTEYVFSYAGDGVSDQSYSRLEEGCEQMLLSALGGLMTEWTERHVFQALGELDAHSS